MAFIMRIATQTCTIEWIRKYIWNMKTPNILKLSAFPWNRVLGNIGYMHECTTKSTSNLANRFGSLVANMNFLWIFSEATISAWQIFWLLVNQIRNSNKIILYIGVYSKALSYFNYTPIDGYDYRLQQRVYSYHT